MTGDKTLVPSIERRLATWLELKQKETPETEGFGGPTITLSRQYGCEAFPLSEELQALFATHDGRDLTIFDRTLIEKVSGDDNILQSVLNYVGSASLMEDLLAPLIHTWHSHEQAFTRLATDILTIAREGDAIIVGRGAAVLTRKLENCWHFRLEAPLDFRVESIAERLGISRDEARRDVTTSQKSREQFIERFLTCDVSDSRHYHAIFDNSKSSITEIAGCIHRLISGRLQSPN